MNLPFVMGTELTGIHAGYPENGTYSGDFDYWEFNNRLEDDIDAVKSYLRRTNTRYHRAEYDDHCIEVSSKKISTFEDFRKFGINVRKALESRFYFPKHPDAVCGGAHIHVDMTGQKRFKYELSRDLVMRPYLPWIFGEPDECGAMDVLINQKNNLERYAIHAVTGISALQYEQWTDYNMSNGQWLASLIKPYDDRTNYTALSDWEGKNHMFRLSVGYNTIEFRFFEMTETWDEQELQLNFLCKYLEWMKKRMENGVSTRVVLMTDGDMQSIEAKTCVDLFNELCYDIGVDADDYKPFIRRNLYPRWYEGRARC